MEAQYRYCRRTFLREVGRKAGERADWADYQGDPIPRFCESLVCAAVGGKLAANRSQQGWDIERPDGRHVQVKVLRTRENVQNDLRLDPTDGTDDFAVVFFENYRPATLIVIPNSALTSVRTELRGSSKRKSTTLVLRRKDRHPLIAIAKGSNKLGIEVFELPARNEQHDHPFV